MKTETTDLVVKFAKSNGGNHNWRFNEVNTSLPAEEIKEACELLTTLNLFEQDGVKLFDSVITAKFVTKIETLIFDKTIDEDPEEAKAEPHFACFPSALPETTMEISEELPPQMTVALDRKENFMVENSQPSLTSALPIDTKPAKELNKNSITDSFVPSKQQEQSEVAEPEKEVRKKRKGLLNRLLSREKKRDHEYAEIRSHDPDDGS